MSTHKPMSAICAGFDNRAAEKKKKPLDTSDEVPIAGKVVVITGANSGIGAAAALEFAKRGARVIMPCRDLKKAQAVVEGIKSKVSGADLTLLSLDLGDIASVRACAAEIRKLVDGVGIAVLVNNAGFYDPGKVLTKTKDGFEAHMGINHLGPFLFTNLLLDLVQAAVPSRIVFTSSMGHQMAELDLDDLMCEKRGAFGTANFGPYSNSKLANMYNAYSLAKRMSGTLAGAGVHTYALCPGHIRSGFTRNTTGLLRLLEPLNNLVALEPAEGADNILYCALSNKCAGETGLMYRCSGLWEGAMEAAIDDQAADRLWEMSEKLVAGPGGRA